MPLGDYRYLTAGASLSGCAGTAVTGGWYLKGSPNPIVASYKNPSTGSPYTWGELDTLLGVGTTTTTPTTTTTGTTVTPQKLSFEEWLKITYPNIYAQGQATDTAQFDKLSAEYKTWYNSQNWSGTTTTPSTTPTTTTPNIEELMALMPQAPIPVAPALAPMPTVTPAPIVEAPTVPAMPAVTPAPAITAPVVTPAPEYKPTAEEQAWSGMTGGEIKSIIEAKGLGIPQETQDLMIRQQTQALTAREDENLRLMANDMERRGITNSGLLFWNTEKIKSATTTAIAASITDIQIKSSLMKMASFENALGQAGQFLGYLQEQSKMVYTGKMATWEAQTQADLIQYQAQISVDLDQWKMENQYNLVGWQANTQALFAAWDKNSTSMVEAWKMANQFNIAEWETQANYDLAVFQIKTQAKMANWAAKMDIYKLGILQAYNQSNTLLQAQIDKDAAAQQHIWDVERAEMEIEAANAQAAAQGIGNIVGTIIGGIFGKA